MTSLTGPHSQARRRLGAGQLGAAGHDHPLGSAPARTASARRAEVGDRAVRRRVGHARDAPGGQARPERGQVGRRRLGAAGTRSSASPRWTRPVGRPAASRSTSGTGELVETDRVDAGPLLSVQRAPERSCTRTGRPGTIRSSTARSRSPATDSWYAVARIHARAGGARSASTSARCEAVAVDAHRRADPHRRGVGRGGQQVEVVVVQARGAGRRRPRRAPDLRRPHGRSAPDLDDHAVPHPHVDGRAAPAHLRAAGRGARRSRRAASASTAAVCSPNAGAGRRRPGGPGRGRRDAGGNRRGRRRPPRPPPRTCATSSTHRPPLDSASSAARAATRPASGSATASAQKHGPASSQATSPPATAASSPKATQPADRARPARGP